MSERNNPHGFEAIAEVEALGRDVFASAWKQEFHDEIPPLLDAKPMGNIYLQILTPTKRSRGNDPAFVLSEQLQLRPARDAEPVQARWRHDPEGMAQQRIIASQYWDTLSNDFVPDLMANGSVAAIHIAKTRGGNEIISSTGELAPTPDRLAAAKSLAQLALGYVRGPLFDAGPEDRLDFIHEPGHTPEEYAQAKIMHMWHIQQTEDMPINGREGDAFLSAHYEFLSDQIETYRNMVAAFSDVVPERAEVYAKKLAKAEASIAAVEQHLFGRED